MFLTAGTARRRGERFTDMNHRNKVEETLIRERLRNFVCVRVCGREKIDGFGVSDHLLNVECISQI